MGSDLKPTAGASLDAPLGPERLRAIDLLGDRWTMWLLLAVHERDGARFSDLVDEPGLSRRVLAGRLRRLVDAELLERVRYSARPPRYRYALTDRAQQLRRLLLGAVHVAAGGALGADPLAPMGAAAAAPDTTDPGAAPEHPIDRLLAADPVAADAIWREAIEPLARYDERYHTSLVETLATWLACDASVSVAAARLHAHRHTVRYRLGRIHELTGLDVAEAGDRERMALGLRVHAARSRS